MSLRYLIMISGIFGKSEELDILPPPPPFPDIEEDEKAKEAERIREQEEKEIKFKRKEDKQKEGARKKIVFDFFHGLGLAKTEKEQREIKKKRQKQKKLKELERMKRLEEERRRELGRERERKQLEEEKQSTLGKKKEDLELEKELMEIGEIALKPTKEKIIGAPEFEFPELEVEKEIGKPEETVKAEEEIQKAIQGMKVKKRPSIISGLFKKKPVEEKIEIPEVMPRTYDKIDHVELIEERMHKARLFLMDFKFDEAKRVYIEIMKIYNELESKKKTKVYQDIKDLYYERKSAEKFAK